VDESLARGRFSRLLSSWAFFQYRIFRIPGNAGFIREASLTSGFRPKIPELGLVFEKKSLLF
jgi:hypothetical protein